MTTPKPAAESRNESEDLRMALPTKECDGIYRKYLVKRLRDREGKHRRCEYFVLDWKHDPFAVPAARAYADACETQYPELAKDLRENADRYERMRNSRKCRGCGADLKPENYLFADGCPCNSPRGVNHGLVNVLTCTCDECDPAQTGSSRYPPAVPLPAHAPAKSCGECIIRPCPHAPAGSPRVMLAAEERSFISKHSGGNKLIESLIASDAAKDEEIARLKARIAELTPSPATCERCDCDVLLVGDAVLEVHSGSCEYAP